MLASGGGHRIISDMAQKRQWPRTTLLTVGFTACLVGMGLARLLPALPGWILAPTVVLTLVSFRRKTVVACYLAVACGLLLGLWRGGIYMQRVQQYGALAKQPVTVAVTATTDATYDKASQISFEADSVELVSPYHLRMVGKLGVAGYGERMIYKGDRVLVSGKFYPTRGSKVANISFSEITATERSHSWLDGLRRQFASGMQNDLPEPQASFGMGLLIGAKSGLDQHTSDILKAVGLTHIVAVSGYNLTIIIQAMRRLFGKKSKYQSLIFSILLIIGFLLVTGLSASIVRASLVCLLSLAAWYYGRTIKPLLLIIFAAMVTALWNPLYLWSDVGWWLSFLAFFGIMIIGPLLEHKIARGGTIHPLFAVLVESFTAQLATIPFILYIFGVSSWISIPANVLVVPLIPLAMLLCFIAGLSGMLAPAIAGWLSWPAKWILTYLLEVPALLQRVPHMQITTQLTALNMVFLYAVLCVALVIIWKKSIKAATVTEVIRPPARGGTGIEDTHVRTLQMVDN